MHRILTVYKIIRKIISNAEVRQQKQIKMLLHDANLTLKCCIIQINGMMSPLQSISLPSGLKRLALNFILLFNYTISNSFFSPVLASFKIYSTS